MDKTFKNRDPIKQLKKKYLVYEMSKDNLPAITVNSGEQLRVKTRDVFGDQIQDENDRVENIDRLLLHPATGPIFVKGAEAGDALEISIIKIKTGKFAVQCIVPDFGLLADDFSFYQTKLYPVKGRRVQFNDIPILIEPMIGTIGVAPNSNSIPCNMPGPHGGNLDCRYIREGAKVILPVFVEGALLALGDVHALQGDGEASGISAEIDASVDLEIKVLKNFLIKGPRVLYKNSIMFLASGENLEKACSRVVLRVVNYLQIFYGLELSDAYRLCTLVGNLEICQVVNQLKTVRMVLAIDLLKSFSTVSF